MVIHDFYYNEKGRFLHVEFSMEEDDEHIYRSEEMMFKDIQLYSPTIIEEMDMNDIDKNFIIELLNEYYKHNEPPKEEFF
jgi:hypothetical protein